MRKIVPTEFFTDSSDTRPLFLAYILCLSLSLSPPLRTLCVYVYVYVYRFVFTRQV